MRKLKERRALWAKRQEIAVARFLQGAFRARKARRDVQQARDDTAANAAAARDMDRLYEENLRKKRVYQNAISEYYRQRKEEYLQSTLMEGFDAAQQAKILRFRRRKEHEAELEKEERAGSSRKCSMMNASQDGSRSGERVKIERVGGIAEALGVVPPVSGDHGGETYS